MSPLGWVEPAVHWLTDVTRPEACTSAAAVNGWYEAFPDPDGRALGVPDVRVMHGFLNRVSRDGCVCVGAGQRVAHFSRRREVRIAKHDPWCRGT